MDLLRHATRPLAQCGRRVAKCCYEERRLHTNVPLQSAVFYKTAAEALEDVVDGSKLLLGGEKSAKCLFILLSKSRYYFINLFAYILPGFGISGIPENLILALRDVGPKQLTCKWRLLTTSRQWRIFWMSMQYSVGKLGERFCFFFETRTFHSISRRCAACSVKILAPCVEVNLFRSC